MRFILVVGLVMCAAAAFAQTVDVTTVQRSMSLGSGTAMTMHVNGIDAKETLKDVAAFWRDQRAKATVKNDEMVAFNYMVKEFKSDTFTLYATTASAKDNGSDIYLWVFDGRDYVGPNHPAYQHFAALFKSFAVAENRKPIEEKLKDSEKQAEKLAREKESLARQRERWRSDIEKAKDVIKESEENLKKSESTLSDLDKSISSQKEDIEKLKRAIDAIQ
jgi:hypothetical protein